MATARQSIAEAVAALRPIDHHVHGAFRENGPRSRFANSVNEASTEPLPDWIGPFDSQLGFAMLAHCAPLLDLPRHVDAATYWDRRDELGEAELAKRFLPAAGVGRWLVDTGFGSAEVYTPEEQAAASGAPASEIVRLEPIAEQLIAAGPEGYADRFRSALADRLASPLAVGTKSVIAYRTGFTIDLSRPADTAVQAAADAWAREAGPRPRLMDPVLLAFGMYAAIDAGAPLQLHTGFGDRDLDLDKADPLHLLDFLRDRDVARVPVLLLHCYPFERHAGYLAQAFEQVYFDVGLAVHYLGGRGAALVARSLEMAPFSKILYSSDAWGPAELHLLGSVLWRDGLTSALTDLVDRDEWSLAQALSVAERIAVGNAERAYRLTGTTT